MKIIRDESGSSVFHWRDINIEDGPVVDAGSSYKAGTKIRVESVRVAWDDDEASLGRIRVVGHRVNKDGGISLIPHELLFRQYNLPDWLSEILTTAQEEN
jgi:hypothetical protein